MLPSTIQGRTLNVDEFFATRQREADDLMAYLKSLSISPVWKKALDFGCGVGRTTQALAGYFDEVYGVDIAPSLVELARQYNHYGNKCKYFLNKENNLNMFVDN